MFSLVVLLSSCSFFELFSRPLMDPTFPVGGSLIRRPATQALISASLLLSLAVLHYNVSIPAFSSLGLRFSFSLPRLSNGRKRRCDYSTGRWRHHGGPAYYTEECPFLDPGFRCRLNGRNDTEYLQWRWKPQSCSLPRFDGRLMLEKSRHRRIVFVGDSIGRNQWESLVCMLWVAAENSGKVYEKNGNPISKHKGHLAMLFQDYNLTVEYYRAPFLVAIGHPPRDSPPAVLKSIHVDLPHWDSPKWVGADVIIFNAGHWWNCDKTLKSGNYFQIGDEVNMTMDVKEAYRRGIETLNKWAIENLHPTKSFAYFISYSQSHYSNGTWDTGGNCDGKLLPAAEGEKPRPEPWNNRVTIEALKEAERGESNVGFINITYLTEQRADGHPSKHREQRLPDNTVQDCSHWCLPGVPDAWNEILFADLLSTGFGARKNNS